MVTHCGCTATLDGNEAVARVAYACSEVIAIYPITPASPMGEFADAWSAQEKANLFGATPRIIQMQSEGGAAGAIHGALQAGSLATTFTASQGLLLMIPNMFKIAGELTSGVIHVAARTVATHALSIFGDHSDVMATRMTGFAMLASSSVQEAQDMALIAHAATLEARVPFLHFFDGFRTSHEINKIEVLDEAVMRSMLDPDAMLAHRMRGLSPDRPSLRGTAQNPDVFFQAREAIEPFYTGLPSLVQRTMNRFAQQTGRQYHLFDYTGAADADRVIVLMGSGAGAAEEAVESLCSQGERVGLLKVRLFRPFDASAFVRALPKSVRSIAVLDRTKEPGSVGEPLNQDVVTSFFNASMETDDPDFLMPRILGGRYGLSSKEFTPSMVASIFDHLKAPRIPKSQRRFTIGIRDDVSGSSLKWNPERIVESPEVMRAIFFGLGSDGTVGANKSSVKIVGERTSLHAQGYFVYDSKKSGSVTVSHLRFSPHPIRSTYLIQNATFVACHQFDLLRRLDVLQQAADGAVFLLNTRFSAERVWDELPREVQQTIIDRHLRFHVIDADTIAKDQNLGGRINTVMQACFFALTDLLPLNDAIAQMKRAIHKSYGKGGQSIIDRNLAAVDEAINHLKVVTVPALASSPSHRLPAIREDSPDFARRVLGQMLAGRGDELPVSALPVDGSFPTATSQYEKRNIAKQIPQWDPALCTECGLCVMVCPHAVVRAKKIDASWLATAPTGFPSRSAGGNGTTAAFTIGISQADCTGCGVCVDVCPAKSKSNASHKALDMVPKADDAIDSTTQFEFFSRIPEVARDQVNHEQVKGAQFLLPLFEYSGACAGCGETPYLKLLSQLFGDRIVIANATGCSSIYGGNLPTTPWSVNAQGRGPAWANSLFEDNAEFGLGIHLALQSQRGRAQQLLRECVSGDPSILDPSLVAGLLADGGHSEEQLADQRERVKGLRQTLEKQETSAARELLALADHLVRKSVWIIGGDGWAYDIGYGGLDHVLASGQDVNILVLDTGVYSNTGGQASKATPRGATAKFAMNGRQSHRKDLGMMAAAYGNVYVAQIAIGANPAQALKAFHEAESYRGPSLILAYSQCIAHGIDLTTGMSHQRDLVRSGFWPLYRFDPRHAHRGERPFHLDSHKPTLRFRDVAMQEARFAMLARTHAEHAEHLLSLAQKDIDDTWRYYEQLANVGRDIADEYGEFSDSPSST